MNALLCPDKSAMTDRLFVVSDGVPISRQEPILLISILAEKILG
jgi:hypothetical protein